MIEKLKAIIRAHIEKGELGKEIEKCTFEIIDSEEFSSLPESVQDAIYQLNMNDVNELSESDYKELLEELSPES